MAYHNKITFTKEYCLCRRIPYRMSNDQLVLGSKMDGYNTIYSVYNLTYSELITAIDKMVRYDPVSTHYIGMVRNI